MLTGSLYFLGKFRPLYIEDDATTKIAIRLRRAASGIADAELRDWLLARIATAVSGIGNGSYSSVAIDHCDRGVSIRRSPRDRQIEAIAASLPDCPGLDYNA